MSWAALRKTTRVEDMAYSLFGIFDVNMSLIYGEGDKAFRRLQEEILKRNNDLTIFAWETPPQHDKQWIGLFASSPAEFLSCNDILQPTSTFLDLSVTTKGLCISDELELHLVSSGNTFLGIRDRYLFLLSDRQNGEYAHGIYLRKLAPGIYYRDGKLPLRKLNRAEINHQFAQHSTTKSYIILDTRRNIEFLERRYRQGAIRIPLTGRFQLTDAVPESLWDISDQIFLHPNLESEKYLWTILGIRGSCAIGSRTVHLLVLCNLRGGKAAPQCVVIQQGDFITQTNMVINMVFQGSNRNKWREWRDPELQPIFNNQYLSNSTTVSVMGSSFRISLEFKLRLVGEDAEKTEVSSLETTIVQVESLNSLNLFS